MKFADKILLLCFFAFVLFGCNSNKESDSDKNDDSTMISLADTSLSDGDFFLPKTNNGVIIRHKYYTLSYVENHEQAEWVAYELKKNDIVYSNRKRPYFIDDPEVKSGSASWKNYIRSGYDRGHLCPAADRRFSKEAFDETFYTSNISPQKNDFNAGLWNRLEQKTRYWAKKYDGLYVVTGGVLTSNLDVIGKEDVSVPEYFFKILIDRFNGEYKAIGFLVPHQESDKPLYSFVVPIDTIEKMTGIDFFSKLPDGIENKIEKSDDYKGWSF